MNIDSGAKHTQPNALKNPIIVTDQLWGEEIQPLVSVSCRTYMHAPFIRDAIEGFLMQETTFPVEILIHDDASTDGTADIVREYEAKHPQLIKATYQVENQYKKNPKTDKYVKPHPRSGKYVSLCEGDDYWTDPLKLQKQVAFMEANPGFSLCFHSVEIVSGHQKTGKTTGAGNKDRVFDHTTLFYSDGFHSPTASLLFRKSSLENRPEWSTKGPVGDIPLKLVLSQKGKFFFMSQVMGVRRVRVPGSWNDRVRNNPEQEYEYHKRMIPMLDGFNAYSNFKYNDEVLDKQLYYTKKAFFFISRKERFELLKQRNFKGSIKRLSLFKKMEFFAVLLLPRLFDKNGIIRRLKSGKRPLIYRVN